ncbi:hypothetical protein PAXRUDRAFT_832805 [Paxillus rubicundulus Ve08.2h10]|uniref:Uncharacterized protein n=1 Tax=Paxillus rubicundulus Ve08.2h10 TaxID=930991 RepID=A0A0D0D0J5_9AGAM|nr:hypothetical protein PAXRUDRAFT_832805 [Paxillus rubicundulus Ve08.2h10]
MEVNSKLCPQRDENPCFEKGHGSSNLRIPKIGLISHESDTWRSWAISILSSSDKYRAQQLMG